MDRPLIVYLHGFCSSPASWKSRLLADYMAERGLAEHFVCPQLSPVPNEAVASVSRLIEAAAGAVTLVGSSLGGHYANHLGEKHDLRAVLINPAAVERLNPAKVVGEHANFHKVRGWRREVGQDLLGFERVIARRGNAGVQLIGFDVDQDPATERITVAASPSPVGAELIITPPSP